MKNYPIPAKVCRTEIKVSSSIFISTISPAFSVSEAREFIQKIKFEFKDASHNVAAFIIGFGESVIEHSTDDGEPSGTAGKPLLSVIKGSGFGDIVIVVTRYFGGVKLGTGGLVRAYTKSAHQVLGITPKAVKVPTHRVSITIPYPFYQKITNLLRKHQVEILDQSFSTEIYMTLNIDLQSYKLFKDELTQISSGQIDSTIISTEEVIRLLKT